MEYKVLCVQRRVNAVMTAHVHNLSDNSPINNGSPQKLANLNKAVGSEQFENKWEVYSLLTWKAGLAVPSTASGSRLQSLSGRGQEGPLVRLWAWAASGEGDGGHWELILCNIYYYCR